MLSSTSCARYMRSTSLSENQKEKKFIASANSKAIIIPCWPPSRCPTDINKAVIAAISIVVLIQFIGYSSTLKNALSGLNIKTMLPQQGEHAARPAKMQRANGGEQRRFRLGHKKKGGRKTPVTLKERFFINRFSDAPRMRQFLSGSGLPHRQRVCVSGAPQEM